MHFAGIVHLSVRCTCATFMSKPGRTGACANKSDVTFSTQDKEEA
jgi:hypothetical protein